MISINWREGYTGDTSNVKKYTRISPMYLHAIEMTEPFTIIEPTVGGSKELSFDAGDFLVVDQHKKPDGSTRISGYGVKRDKFLANWGLP